MNNDKKYGVYPPDSAHRPKYLKITQGELVGFGDEPSDTSTIPSPPPTLMPGDEEGNDDVTIPSLPAVKICDEALVTNSFPSSKAP